MHQLLKVHIERKEFDHGYLMVGDPLASREASFEIAKAILFPNDIVSRLETHPDFFYQKYDLFGIKDSKELIYKASQTPLLGDKKVFIIETLSFSIESANALLKTLEEPFSGTHFFIIVSSADVIIPTLRSRLTLIDNKNIVSLEKEKKDFYTKFLKDLPNKRLDSIAHFLKDRQKAIEFLNEFEVVLLEKMRGENIELVAKSLEEIQKNKNLLFFPSASVKMILEHLALTLPKIV